MSAGLALTCDPDGAVLRVLVDSMGLTRDRDGTSTLADILPPEWADRATRLLSTAVRDGAAFGWEFGTAGSEVATLELSAVCLGSELLVVAHSPDSGMLYMLEDLTRANSLLVNTVRELRQVEAGHSLAERDLDGLTRLNIEMASAQRRLLRRIAELEFLERNRISPNPRPTPVTSDELGRVEEGVTAREPEGLPDGTEPDMPQSIPQGDGGSDDVLRAALHSRDNFLAAMSHEFFTPLNSVIGYSHMLLMEVPGPLNDAQRTQVELVKEAGEYLQRVALDVLDLTRLRSGAYALDPAVFDLRDIVEPALRSIGLPAREAGVGLAADVADVELFVKTDERRVLQVVTRLLGNGVKFTAPGGTVTLAIARQGDSAEISVTDTGVGISREDRERVFEQFAQLPDAEGRNTPGTGVGLTIARHVLSLLGSELHLDSIVGSGTRCSFRIPLVERSSGSA